MSRKPTTPIDSFPILLSKPLSYCVTKKLYKATVRHVAGYNCELTVMDYNTEEVLFTAIHNIEYIEDLIITVDNLKISTILYGNSK